MKILAVADLHYALPQYDWVAAVAERYDVVIIAGDHLDLSSLVDARAQIVVVRKYIDLIGQRTRLLTSSGNHDLDTRDAAGEKVAAWMGGLGGGIVVDGQSFRLGDTLFTICPWWDGPAVRDRVAAQLATDAAEPKAHWFWVHHAPPDGSPVSWGGERFQGDQPLAEWIALYTPDIVFSGHVHRAPFTRNGSWVDKIGRTWVFNAGHQFGAPPAYVALDTEERQAVWVSAAGVQAVNLDRPLQRPVPALSSIPDWLEKAERGPVLA